ncbi:MAG: PD-(D/E)XK nuclease family protein [Lachnospiraceae bacterium]|jgi:hypothetical protein|nr:PD-(D/E)XK nuclease family protein [Lachnospiraceae bacterium]
MSKLILPRVFKDTSKDGKYKHLIGKPKLSYSQITSWKDAKYHYDYIKQYFVGITMDSGIFAQAGTDFGTMVEWIGNGRVGKKPQAIILTQSNVEEVAEKVEYKPNSIYEDLIVVDCGDFVIEGYADRCTYYEDTKEIEILDYKTGNMSKPDKYKSNDYMQTRLYAYQKENDGYNVKSCGVELFDRKGNGSEKYPIRLTGELMKIDTPYNRDEVEEWLKNDISKIASEISDCYKTYLKIFK